MLFFWKESACQWQWERSLGIFSYKLIRSSLGLLHRFLGSLRKFIRFLTSAPQTIEYQDVIRWIHKKNSDTWSEGRKVFQCLWWNKKYFFYLFYFLFSFHSCSPLPKEFVLFSGTLRLNLDPFNELVDEELWRVLEVSHLKRFVKSLSEGLRRVIAEGGENLM